MSFSTVMSIRVCLDRYMLSPIAYFLKISGKESRVCPKSGWAYALFWRRISNHFKVTSHCLFICVQREGKEEDLFFAINNI